MKDYYVYMLLCKDGTYYVGITNDLNRRVYEHEVGYNVGSYTSMRRPVRLVYYSIFHNVNEAISWEKTIKKWSKAKKEALIKGDWDRIVELSNGK